MNHSARRHVFVTGSTGYMGRSLIPALLHRGHQIRALARGGSEGRLPGGCDVVTGDPLDRRTFTSQIAPADTFVHLVGTPRPSSAKAQQFREIDLVSMIGALVAAVENPPDGIHIVEVPEIRLNAKSVASTLTPRSRAST